jgi:hypothetical protein
MNQKGQQQTARECRVQPDDGVDPHAAYTPTNGLKIISIMADGYSITVSAGKMGVDLDTIRKWTAEHPEFADALKRATSLYASFWETKFLTARTMSDFKLAAYVLSHDGCAEHDDRAKPIQNRNELRQIAKQIEGTALKPREDD